MSTRTRPVPYVPQSGPIRSLHDALIEALTWLCVEGKDPPYVVPYAIQGDLWKKVRVSSYREAIETIREAVAMAAT